MTTPQPFSWILKPHQLAAPTRELAALLRHEYAAQLSEILRETFELAYGPAEREAKRHLFVSSCRRDDRGAIAHLYELLVLAMLSLEHWFFIDVEGDFEGETHPEFLMAVPPDYHRMLVEVKTVHRADALTPCDEARLAFEAHIKARLGRCGYECESVALHAVPGQVPGTDQYDAMVELALARARRSTMKACGYFGVELPTGAQLDLLLADPGFQGPLAGELKAIERSRAKITAGSHDTLRFFDEKETLEESYSEKIPRRIGRAAAQIEKTRSGLPAIVAIATSDPSWTVREARNAADEELKYRQANRAIPVAVLLVSFFQPKPKLIPESPDWVKTEELRQWRKTFVLGAHAIWEPISDAAPTVSHIHTHDPRTPKAVITVPPMMAAVAPKNGPGRRLTKHRRKR